MTTNQQIMDALFLLIPGYQTDDPEVLARYNSLIDLLKCFVCEGVFGKCYVLAMAYMLAHVLYTGSQGPVIGGVSSLTEGGLSISYAVGKDALADTVWGRQYLQLLKASNLTSSFTTGGGICAPYGPFVPNFGSGWIRPFPGGGCGC